MGNSAKRDARTAEKMERCRKVLELRKAGASLQQIGQALPSASGKPRDKSNVQKDLYFALRLVASEPAKEVLALELSRCDTAITKLWPVAMSLGVKDGKPLPTAGIALKTMKELREWMRLRADYLGLYKPVRHELTGADGAPLFTKHEADELTDEQLLAVASGKPLPAHTSGPGAGTAGTPTPGTSTH